MKHLLLGDCRIRLLVQVLLVAQGLTSDVTPREEPYQAAAALQNHDHCARFSPGSLQKTSFDPKTLLTFSVCHALGEGVKKARKKWWIETTCRVTPRNPYHRNSKTIQKVTALFPSGQTARSPPWIGNLTKANLHVWHFQGCLLPAGKKKTHFVPCISSSHRNMQKWEILLKNLQSELNFS